MHLKVQGIYTDTDCWEDHDIDTALILFLLYNCSGELQPLT